MNSGSGGGGGGDVLANLERLASNAPPTLQGYFKEFHTIYEKKLWHQLTGRLQAYFAEPLAKPSLPIILSQFVTGWHKKMNPLIFVKLAVEASRQLSTEEALTLLEGVVEEVKQLPKPDGPIITIFASMEVAHYKLCKGDLSGTKSIIESCADVVETFAGVDPIIPASFYRVSADYDKVSSDFASFYRNALLYLTCVKVEDISMSESQERAHDLCIAALLGDTIYNFGDLLEHPILNVLASTQYSYLVDALHAFNAGSHAAFEKLTPSMSQHPTLSTRMDFLGQKFCLMSLVDVVFRQLETSRILPFSDFSKATQIPLDQVEFLLMKALSSKLVKGFIDEPEKSFIIEWVHPRVLNRSQIAELRQGIQGWRERVQETCRLIHTLVPEQLAGAITF